MTDDYEGRVNHPPLGVGEALAPGYEIIEHLHQSKNFDVYDVWSAERACRCVAKMPRQDLVGSAKVRRGLLREGRLLLKLTHPHIVRAYEVVREPHPVLVLETLTGETLSHMIDTRERRLPVSDVVHLGLHLCSAIHYLHRHDVLHLDLKPSNIVSERGLAKILDLSIARPPGRARKGAGTPQYMAPEQVRGEPVSPATDVWGIGAVLFEALTAETPFNAEYRTSSGSPDNPADPQSVADPESGNATDTCPDGYEQILRRADPIRAHRRRVPAILADAVDGCLEPEPARRQTVDGLATRLTALA